MPFFGGLNSGSLPGFTHLQYSVAPNRETNGRFRINRPMRNDFQMAVPRLSETIEISTLDARNQSKNFVNGRENLSGLLEPGGDRSDLVLQLIQSVVCVVDLFQERVKER
jgi:hypothetical protein